MTLINDEALARRRYWIGEIVKLSGNFGVDVTKVQKELAQEVSEGGEKAIVEHLRLCGSIPENYEHDSSEEKLYSKYTDVVLSEAYKSIGLKSIVLTERADVADVEAYAENYDFVADAKAFRLSRTAKNQKDFKVQAMDNWRHGKVYAMVVAPLYQLPSTASQIYQQAAARNVSILSYSHLSFLVRYSAEKGSKEAIELLHRTFSAVSKLNPSKSANAYWTTINNTLISSDGTSESLWSDEKTAYLESVQAAKEEALEYLSNERKKIMNLSHEDALKQLLKANKIENRIDVINKIQDNGLFEVL